MTILGMLIVAYLSIILRYEKMQWKYDGFMDTKNWKHIKAFELNLTKHKALQFDLVYIRSAGCTSFGGWLFHMWSSKHTSSRYFIRLMGLQLGFKLKWITSETLEFMRKCGLLKEGHDG